jgi:predicted membrane-bound spermidine synthase
MTEKLVSKISAGLWYMSIFLSGAAILVIEILGTRILAPIYGTTIYVWSGLITVTLFSLALGYFIGGKLADKKHSPFWFYGLFLSSGLLLLSFFEYRAGVLLYSERFGVMYGPLVVSFLLFAIPLWVLGMVDPFAVRLRTKSIKVVGSNTGYVLGIATAGGLVGSLMSAYILLPNLPISVIFRGLSFLLIVTGVTGLLSSQLLAIKDKQRLTDIKKARKSVLKLTAAVIALGIFTVFGNFYNNRSIQQSDRFGKAVILYEKQNLYSLNRVLAVPSVDGVRCFAADGALQTCIDPNNKDLVSYAGKMGLFIEQLPTDSRMLLLGLGGGKILKEWGRDDIDIDVVDINPATFYATENYLGVDYKERYTKNTVDARRFLRSAPDNTYDLILIDVATTLSPPAHLYTQEFYELLSKKLKDDGTVVKLLHEDQPFIDRSFQSFIKTIRMSFDHLYTSQDGVPMLITMSRADNARLLNTINSRVRDVQKIANTVDNFKPFVPLNGSLDSENPVIITDDHNTVELLWRNKLLLFQRFNLLIEGDVR